MTEFKNLKNMPYAQAQVKITDDEIVLISYETNVVFIDKKTGYVTCSGTYRPTTRKHIGAFCKEYLPKLSYQDIKQLYLKNEAYNIYSGEIVPIERFYCEVTDINGNKWEQVYDHYTSAKEIVIGMINMLQIELDMANIISTATGEILLSQHTYYGELYEAGCDE